MSSDAEEESLAKKRLSYRQDKPWDDGTTNKWKMEPVDAENPLDAPIEESTFATLFPKYREKYLREVWPLVTRKLKEFGISCDLNLLEGSMSVKTTRKMFDPYMIIKARDMLKLLARSLPLEQATRIFEDDMFCDIIKIKNLVPNKDRFVKRRSRLIGPNACTLKAIELVTECFVMVQGSTVTAMGNFTNLKAVRRIVEDCMKNVHPVYRIKEMMIKRELAKDPVLKNENWERFLPKFKKKNIKKRKIVFKEKKEYTPFPPAPLPRKIDLQMESGEYWMTQEQKEKKDQEEKKEAAVAKQAGKKKEKAKLFVPPEEKASSSSSSSSSSSADTLSELKRKISRGRRNDLLAAANPWMSQTGSVSSSSAAAVDFDVDSLKHKLTKSFSATQGAKKTSATDFLATSGKEREDQGGNEGGKKKKARSA